MKKKIYILSFLILLSLSATINSYGQEKLSNVMINNVIRMSTDRVRFDIRMQRTSELWIKFANGTYEFQLDTNLYRNYDQNLGIRRLDTELPEDMSAGDLLPNNGYITNFYLYDTRIAITVLGPPNFDDCIYIPMDETVLIGTYEIWSKDATPIGDELFWCEPEYYYQALAYKTNQEITFPEKPYLKYDPDDNVPMVEKQSKVFMVDYSVDQDPPYKYVFDYFDADYVGRRQIDLVWKTEQEIYCRGYTVLRYPDINDPDIERDTIYTYKEASQYFNSEMLSKGASSVGFSYGTLPDEVEYIGGKYCYELYANLYDNNNDRDTLVGVSCPTVPALLIAEATPDRNPFNIETTVKYELLDDAYVSIKVYDAVGRELMTLSDDNSNQLLDGTAELKEGFQYVTFTPSPKESSGAYNIIIRAIPVLESNEIEQGYVDVKVELMR